MPSLGWGHHHQRGVGPAFRVVDVQSLSRVRLFATPRTVARQTPVLHYVLESAQIHVH